MEQEATLVPNPTSKSPSPQPAQKSFGCLLLELYRESTLTSGTLAVLLVGTVCACVLKEIPVPEILSVSMTTVIAFFFGAKMGRAQELNNQQRLNVR